jgi:ParB-like chromosome segregation protein Spo0J
MQIESWPIGKFIEYENNPRKNDHAIEQIAAAFKNFGFRVPVIAKSSGEVIDGHLRLKAARHIGLTDIPVILADDLTDIQIKAFRISVNRMAELADWDDELLALEFLKLKELDFDLELTGFRLDEIEAFGADEGNQEGSTKEIDPDEYELKNTCPRCGFEYDDHK